MKEDEKCLEDEEDDWKEDENGKMKRRKKPVRRFSEWLTHSLTADWIGQINIAQHTSSPCLDGSLVANWTNLRWWRRASFSFALIYQSVEGLLAWIIVEPDATDKHKQTTETSKQTTETRRFRGQRRPGRHWADMWRVWNQRQAHRFGPFQFKIERALQK